VSTQLVCFRCRVIELEPSNRGSDLEIFFKCPACEASYRFENDGPLVDRWLMPVTLPLYEVLSYDKPESRAEQTALGLSTLLANRSPIARQRFVDDIEAELAAPRQPLRRVLDDPSKMPPTAKQHFADSCAESPRHFA
jgi:hypothetical protein